MNLAESAVAVQSLLEIIQLVREDVGKVRKVQMARFRNQADERILDFFWLLCFSYFF